MKTTEMELARYDEPVVAPVALRAYSARLVSVATAIDTSGDPILVQQHYADEVDINTIVRRHGLTAGMPSGALGGVYGDFSGIDDFDSAVAAVERARQGFMVLPAEVRERFGNDPSELIRAVHELREDEFMELLTPAEAPPAPIPAAAPPAPVPPPPSGEGGSTT